MNPDITKLNFLGTEPIDKVVFDDKITSRNTGPSGAFYNTSDNIQVVTVDNPYDKKCLVNYRWSIDGVNFNSPETILEYSFTVDARALGGPISDPITGYKAAVAVGVSASSVIFQIFNGYHGDVTYTFGNDVYAAFPLDFTVEYALKEVT